MEIKTCFFCLTSKPKDFGNTKSGSEQGFSRVGSLNNVNILLKYLLDTKNAKNDSLLEKVRQVLGGSINSTEGSSNDLSIQICSSCQSSANCIAEAHKQLEVLQMKIIHNLKSVKETVLQYFGSNGNEEELRQTLEVVLPGRKGRGESENGRDERMLDIISDFQVAVNEKGKRAVEAPLVILDRYSFTRKRDNISDLKGTPSCLTTEAIIVKTEAQNQDFEDDIADFLDQYDDSAFDCHDDDDKDFLANIQIHDDQSAANKNLKTKRTTNATRKRKAEEKKSPESSKKKLLSSFNPSERQEKRTRRSTKAATPTIFTTTDNVCEMAPLPSPQTQKPTRPKKQGKVKKTKATKPPKKVRKVKKAVGEVVRKKEAPRPKFYCDLCPYKNKIIYLFENHLRSHEATSSSDTITPNCIATTTDNLTKFTCDQCFKTFSNNQYYRFHMDGHQKSGRKIKCDFCTELIPYSEIAEHLKSHQLEKIFNCPNCSFCCSTRDHYLVHLRFHGKGKLSCDICQKIFRIKGKLLQHLHQEHNSINKYICEVADCHKEFYDIAHLKIHMNIHKKPQQCQECGKICLNTTVLKVHQRTHSREKTFSCADCPEKFYTKDSLQYHRINIHGDDKFKCEYCDKEYSSKNMLQVHMTIHEGTGIPCGSCDKVFGNMVQWRRHQSVHNTEHSFVCEDCGKAFRGKDSLKRHMKIHGSEKKYKCQFCDKVFLFRKYLLDHERVHTGERPYTCSVCGKGFSQYGSLLLHNKKTHLANSQMDIKFNVDA